MVSMTELRYDIFRTEMGWCGILASALGLRRLALRATPQEAFEELGPEEAQAEQDPTGVEVIRRKLESYLGGEGGALDDIPLDLTGAPPFFRAAWQACRTIPAGETRSYAWLAAVAGRPGAFRAAGQAMARNPLSVVIPCHRVISSSGGLHGYGGGLDRKARLLELDRESISGRD